MLKRPLTVFALGVALAAAWWGYRQHQDDFALKARLAMTVAPRSSDFVDCASFTDQKPLVLLALGQSNAGNHGSLSASADAPVLMMIGTHCLVANDPLPGATGSGGSIWRHLPTMLGNELAGRKVVLSVLAVDATSMNDWIRPGSAIGKRLADQIVALRRQGLSPDFLLWQHGEADARNGTSASHYLDGLEKLALLSEKAGTPAPLLLAHSTVCRSDPSKTIRAAIDSATKMNIRFVAGPDTDLLLGDTYRHDGCHLNSAGQRAAARDWAAALKPHIVMSNAAR